MKLSVKLNKYFQENGVLKSWFAKKLGITQAQLYNALQGTNTIPVKCWVKVVELTRGEITITDLMKEKFKYIEHLEVSEMGDPTICRIKIKIKR